MSRALADALEKLLAAQGSAAASEFTSAQRRQLDIFARHTGAVLLVTQGRGASYLLSKPALVQSHLAALRPMALAALDPELPSRANNIARTRSSKGRAHQHARAYLLLKAIGPNVAWTRGEQIRHDVSVNTQLAGAAAMAIAVDDDWTTDAPVWLVENQALFDRLDWLPADAHGTLVYYGGQLSNVLLDWLAERERASAIVFFPDYDGVGLLNYARLLEKSRAPVRFWLMPAWRELLQQFGNNGIWQGTRSQFDRALERLAASGMAPELDQLCRAMALHGLALEHEAVWLAP